MAGLVLIVFSANMLWGNHEEELFAAKSGEALLAQTYLEPTEGILPEKPLPSTANAVPEMATILLDADACIGYLELPTISLELPVLSEWSYSRLRKAPCRYWGNVHDDSLVILAHNYDRHFGRISTLAVGDPVQFVDVSGDVFRYVVSSCETLAPKDVDRMLEDASDLTLFTCTFGGRSRVAVRLSRVAAF